LVEIESDDLVDVGDWNRVWRLSWRRRLIVI